MTQLEQELKLCRDDFRFFLCYCFYNIYKQNFILYDFHNRLIDVLLQSNEDKRIIVNAPPRIGKTEIIKHYIAWQFIKNPASSIIYVSYDERLVARKNREIQDILKFMARRFSLDELRFLPNSDGKTEWVNKAQGTIIARGSNTGLTGSGASTLMVIDDPNKPDDRSMPSRLEHRNRVFTSTVRNRINTPDVPIIIVQQRISINDLSGFLLNGGTNEKWVHYNFPAINPDGTALCPERLPLDEIETYKKQPFEYNAQYLQIPLDDVGKLFNRNKLVVGIEKPNLSKCKLVASVDAASKGDIGNDFNAISICAYDGIIYHVLKIYNFRSDITVLLDKCRQIRREYPNIPFVIESKANGTACVQILRKEMSGILEIDPCRNKVDRAIVVKHLFDGFNVKFHITDLVWGETLTQFCAFPHGKNDDIVDSVVQGITWLFKLPKIPQNSEQIQAQVKQLQRPVFKPRGVW